MLVSFNEIMRKALEVFPNSELKEDNEGQIIIYTNLFLAENGEDDGLYTDEEDKIEQVK